LFHKVVNRLPSAEIEVADAEIRAVGDLQGGPKRGEQVELDVIEDAGHRIPHAMSRLPSPEAVHDTACGIVGTATVGVGHVSE